MAKWAKSYESTEQGLRVREAACRMAADIISAEGGLDDKSRLWSLCVFFESYMAHGAKATLKDFGPPKARKAPVIQLISRD